MWLLEFASVLGMGENKLLHIRSIVRSINHEFGILQTIYLESTQPFVILCSLAILSGGHVSNIMLWVSRVKYVR